MIGQTISHYKIIGILGEGGMGVVYKAEDLKLRRPVALKFLRPDALESEEHETRFINEAQAIAALDHPNICTVYEIDEAEGRMFIAMAFVEGQSLERKIESGPLPLNEALDIAIQIGKGSREAHQNGIVHRDIKTANVMVTDRGDGDLRVKLMDFGLAHLARVRPLTKEGTTLGTVSYMSPEQAQGKTVNHLTDIWSLGVVLYEMVTGQRPFRGEYEAVVLYSITNESPEPMTALRTGLPIELERIVGKCLAKNPGARYQDVSELLIDLRALERQSVSATRKAVPRQPPVSRRSWAGWHVRLAALAVALIVGAAVWFGVIGPTARIPEAPMRLVPLTSYAGTEEHPSFSPDGNRVAFCWDGDKQDNYDIYVKLIGRGPPLRLTTNPANDRRPAWSPDGRQIAFLRERTGYVLDVLLISSIGGPERKLTELRVPPSRDAVSAYFGTSLAWSADGKYLAVPDQNSPDEPPGIFLLSVENGEKQRLTAPPAHAIDDREPAFSPDGRTVAFERYSASAVTYIYTVPVTGGRPTRIAFIPAEPRGLAWTADGREIVFSRPDGLWRISASGGEPQHLFGIEGDAGAPAISGEGRRLAYSQRERDIDIWRIDARASKSSLPTRFISSTRRDAGPQFSPDGKRIVFWSNRSGTPEIWVCDSNGANPRQVTSFGGPHAGTPRWSPDSRNIVFDSRIGENPEIFVASPSSVASPRRVTRNPSEDVVPSWSRDGRWIYFASNRTGEMQVWKVPVEGEVAGGSSAVQVTHHGGFAAFESPDGKFVYYAKRRAIENAIWRVPVDGGEETPVIESLSSGWGHWAVLDEGIYFVDRMETSSSEWRWVVNFFHFDQLRVSQVAELRNPPPVEDSGLSVSPDGRWVLCVQDESSSDLMLVENFQ